MPSVSLAECPYTLPPEKCLTRLLAASQPMMTARLNAGGFLKAGRDRILMSIQVLGRFFT